MNAPVPDKVPCLYFGNLQPSEPQYKSGQSLGLAPKPLYDREIFHDATQPRVAEALCPSRCPPSGP